MNSRWIITILVLLILSSCSTDSNVSTINELEEINLRLRRDPGQINPFFARTSIGREVYQYIFLSVADFHPETLEIYPVMIEAIPEGYETTTASGEAAIGYDLTFRETAEWSDSQPVTASDYVFTVNMLKHPLCKAAAWKPYTDNILDMKLYEDNPQKLSVYLNPNYMLSLETCVSMNLMPQHIYDPNNQLNVNAEINDTLQISLMDKINNSVNERVDIVQAGPYQITSEVTDEYLILEKKDDYWGDALSDVPAVEGHAKKMIFKIVPDELTAVTMAKENKLDFLEIKSTNTFLDLRDNSPDSFSFHTPQLIMSFHIAMNNSSLILSDKIVRNAMSHLMDVDDIIQSLDGGLGVRTIGPFHPTKSYYNESITPIPYDVNKAKELLKIAGWSDTDGDGILDKIIKGEKTKLELEFLITGSELSKNIALTFQDGAKKAGVQINIVSKKISVMRKENLYTQKYDMAALANSSEAIPDDPYSTWHSDNAIPGKRNTSVYINPKSDALIEKIRQTRDEEERKKYYLELQQNIYEDQPMIFLYSPLLKFIGSNDLAITTTNKRPGYMVNTFKNIK